MIDSYKTISKPVADVLFKDKNSKFFGFAYPVNSEEEVKNCLEELKKQHPAANHHCYAYQIGFDTVKFRANDDGEPNNSAGMPIYGQIQSFDCTNVLLVVVRYFGGTKLGVSGLINAYRETAKLTLEASRFVNKIITKTFLLKFGYDKMSKVMRIIKEHNLELQTQKMELACEFTIAVRRKNADEIFNLFNAIYQVDIQELEV